MKSGTTVGIHVSEMLSLQAGDVTDDIYPILAVYQRIFNPLTKILH